MKVCQLHREKVQHKQDRQVSNRIEKRLPSSRQVVADRRTWPFKKFYCIEEKTVIHVKDRVGNIVQQGAEMDPVFIQFLSTMRAEPFFYELTAIAAGGINGIPIE